MVKKHMSVYVEKEEKKEIMEYCLDNDLKFSPWVLDLIRYQMELTRTREEKNKCVEN